MTTQVTAYASSDGELFLTIEQCEEHEFSLLWRERIGEFIKSKLNRYNNGAQVSMVERSITAWEKFKVQQAAPNQSNKESIK